MQQRSRNACVLKYKDAIFARYRAMAEALGILLLNAAKKARMNVMVETSGRDIASLVYRKIFSDDSKYRKLVVNFSIDKLVWAQNSVGGRMKQEMREGRAAILRQASIQSSLQSMLVVRMVRKY